MGKWNGAGMEQYDMIAVTESWATEDVTDAELSVEGFAMFWKDQKGRLGGSVLLYIKEDKPVQSSETISDIEFEDSMWCIARLRQINILV
jgi:hypothetical protein